MQKNSTKAMKAQAGNANSVSTLRKTARALRVAAGVRPEVMAAPTRPHPASPDKSQTLHPTKGWRR